MLLTPNSEYLVVLDACVLAPMPLCDTLLRCAEEPRLFQLLWSRQALDEVRRTLLKFGCSAERAARRVEAMQQAFPDALVDPSAHLRKALEGIPDRDDWHVIAAAMDRDADAIVTLNLRHFPASVLKPLGIDVYSPDDFLVQQFARDPERILANLESQASDIGGHWGDLLDRMMPGLPNFVRLVQRS